jgi:hypothetical protein
VEGREKHARIFLDSRQRGAVKTISHVDQKFLLDVYQVAR